MSFKPKNFTVWAEIPVVNLDRSMKFFGDVLQTELKRCDESGMTMAVFETVDESGVAGHLYEGKPGLAEQGTAIHLACPDSLEDSLGRVKDSGGKVVSDIVTIPPGRFAYCTDLDGNRFGLFQEAV